MQALLLVSTGYFNLILISDYEGGWVTVDNHVWVGGEDVGHNGAYSWATDGQPWTSYSNSLWAPGYPTAPSSGNYCTAVSMTSATAGKLLFINDNT